MTKNKNKVSWQSFTASLSSSSVFTNPQAFWLLSLLPLLLLSELWRAHKRKHSLRHLREHQQISRLLRLHQHTRRLPTLLLRLLAFSLAICALAKPQWGTESIARFEQSKKLYLAIDLSRSMWANDVGINRLERAKILARDIIQAHSGQTIALISFTNKALVEVPPTADADALLEQLNYLSPETALGDGTDLSKPIELVHKLSKANDNARLVLLSDGENLDSESLSSLEKLALAQIPLLTIGIGKEEDSPIPESAPSQQSPQLAENLIRNNQGELVFTRLEKSSLEQLAKDSNGAFYLHNQESQIMRWIETQLNLSPNPQKNSQKPEALYYEEVPRNQYALFLSLALLSLLLAELLSSTWKKAAPKKSPQKLSKLTSRNSSTLALLFALFITNPLLLPNQIHAQSYEYRQANQTINPSNPPKQTSTVEFSPPQERHIKALTKSWNELTQNSQTTQTKQNPNYQQALANSTSALLSPEPKIQAQAHTQLAHILHLRGLSELQDALQSAQQNQQNTQQFNLSEVPWDAIAADWVDALENLTQAQSITQDPLLKSQQQAITHNLNTLEALRAQSPPPPPEQNPADAKQQDNQDKQQEQSQNSTSPDSPPNSNSQEQDQNSSSNPSNQEQKDQQEQQQDSKSDPNQDPQEKQEPQEPNPQASPDKQNPNTDPQAANTSSSTSQPPTNTPPQTTTQAQETLEQEESAAQQERLLQSYAGEVPNLLGNHRRRNSQKKSW